MHIPGGGHHHGKRKKKWRKRGKRGADCCLFEALDPCYVATAAHGEDSPHLTTLRAYRDEVLRPHRAGRAFIYTYYALGPIPAALVRRSPRFAAFTRRALRPVIAHAERRVRRP